MYPPPRDTVFKAKTLELFVDVNEYVDVCDNLRNNNNFLICFKMSPMNRVKNQMMIFRASMPPCLRLAVRRRVTLTSGLM